MRTRCDKVNFFFFFFFVFTRFKKTYEVIFFFFVRWETYLYIEHNSVISYYCLVHIDNLVQISKVNTIK